MSEESISPIPNADELETLLMARAGWRHPDDYPESLHHYTSSAAFLSILQNNELWFTDFRYLNDLSELKYGVDLFSFELVEREQKQTNRDILRLLTGIRNHFDEALVYIDQFVFSMCEDGNLLNQWRVYGRDVVPISIEFPTRSFMFVGWEPNDFELIPMVYDIALQKRIIGGALDAAIEYATQHSSHIFKNEESFHKFVEMFASAIVGWCASMKHPQFEVEKEWRLAVRWGSGHRFGRGQRFRVGAAGIIPYLAVRPAADDELASGQLSIRSITIGPCNQPDIQKRTLQELLYQHVRADTEVYLSNLPIRT